MKRTLVVVAISGLCITLGACTAATREVNRPVETPPTQAAATTTTPTTAPIAHVGATLSLRGQNNEALSVTVSSIVDPATGAGGLGPQDGSRLVAVNMTITNTGSAALTGDADNDASIIGSDGQTYTASFFPVTGCTNFDSGQYQLGPNEATTGCTSYQIPPGVTPAKIRYSPDSGFSSEFGEWEVP